MTHLADRTIALRGGLAAVLAAGLNAGIVAVTDDLDIAPAFEALAYPPVVFLSVLSALAATAVFALVVRLSARPRRSFLRLAGAVLVLSFLPDILLLRVEPTATVAGVLVLMIMHVVAAYTIVGLLMRSVGDER